MDVVTKQCVLLYVTMYGFGGYESDTVCEEECAAFILDADGSFTTKPALKNDADSSRPPVVNTTKSPVSIFTRNRFFFSILAYRICLLKSLYISIDL